MRLASSTIALLSIGILAAGCNNNSRGRSSSGSSVASVGSNSTTGTGATVIALPSGLSEPRGVAASQGTDLFYVATQASANAPVVVRMDKAATMSQILLTGGTPGTTNALVEPIGLALSPDESTLYIADAAADFGSGTAGAILSLPTAGGAPTELADGQIDAPTGLALSPDGKTLYVTGFDPKDGEPALFSIPASGGTASELAKGSPLVLPTGVGVSADGQTLFVADRHGSANAAATLFSLSSGSSTPSLLTTAAATFDQTTPGAGVLAFGSGNVVVATSLGATASLTNVESSNGADTTRLTHAPLAAPLGLSSDGTHIYVCDLYANGTGALIQTN